jgi:membrane protease YdiL (CAAX protease family)
MYLDNFSVSRLDAETAIQVLIILPVIEEVVFRGLIQPWLANRYNQKKMGITQANLITSCLFVLVHLYQHNLIMALYTFVPSLVFGYTRDRYKRLMPSIILHSSYNGGYFLIGSQLINY